MNTGTELISQIRETEEHLHFTTSEFEKLELELKRSLEDLSRCDEERGMMESHLNESKRKYEICHSQKKGLQVRRTGEKKDQLL